MVIDTDTYKDGLAEFFRPMEIDKSGPLVFEYNIYVKNT